MRQSEKGAHLKVTRNENEEEYNRSRGKGGEETGDALEDNGEKKINVDEARNADEKLRGQAEWRRKRCSAKKRKREKGCSVGERNESLVNEGEV